MGGWGFFRGAVTSRRAGFALKVPPEDYRGSQISRSQPKVFRLSQTWFGNESAELGYWQGIAGKRYGRRIPNVSPNVHSGEWSGAISPLECGERAGARTQDQRLKRAMLYQLSYPLAPCLR